jgi:hypothetical protein
MTDFAHLLDWYLAARSLPPAFAEGAGGLAFDAGEGLMVCARASDEGGFEFFANPGYLDAWELHAVIENGEQDDDDDDGVLLRWEAAGAEWSISADRDTGLVVLSQIRADVPHDFDSLAAALAAMLEAFASWAARLQRTASYLLQLSPLSPSFSDAHIRI